jgi:hypothetical protein
LQDRLAASVWLPRVLTGLQILLTFLLATMTAKAPLSLRLVKTMHGKTQEDKPR